MTVYLGLLSNGFEPCAHVTKSPLNTVLNPYARAFYNLYQVVAQFRVGELGCSLGQIERQWMYLSCTAVLGGEFLDDHERAGNRNPDRKGYLQGRRQFVEYSANAL